MKIGFLIRYFKPGMGGAENNCYYLAKELAKDKENEVHIFCSAQKNDLLEEVIDNIKIHRAKTLINLTYYLAFYPGITKKILNEKLDILHMHGFGFIQNDLAVRKIKKLQPSIKLVCTPHGPFMALTSYTFIKRFIKNIYMPFIRKNLKAYDGILQVNPYQLSWLTRDYGIDKKKVYFLPNGLTEDSLDKPDNNRIKLFEKKYDLRNKFVVSYLGRIQKYKGLDQLIKILPRLNKLNKNIVFLAIGKDSGDMQRLSALAKELGVEKQVIFTGEITNADKYSLLDLSEVFIFPSEWEAFGIVVLEAMARENAVISTRTEGGLYLIKSGVNGYLYDYQNLEELFARFKLILNNPISLKKMQKINKAYSKEFLWSKIAITLTKLYSSLLNNVK